MRNNCNCNESYIERMHKCSAAQWEKRLELKDRDFHRIKLNKCKAGVVNTGSSNGFEPFEFSRRRRTPTKAQSHSTIRLSAYGLHPDCMRAAYELRMIAYKQMPLGYKYGDRSK